MIRSERRENKVEIRMLIKIIRMFIESRQGTVIFMGPIAKIGIGYSIFLITLLFGAKKRNAK